jgi:hypothetical protein
MNDAPIIVLRIALIAVVSLIAVCMLGYITVKVFAALLERSPSSLPKHVQRCRRKKSVGIQRVRF